MSTPGWSVGADAEMIERRALDPLVIVVRNPHEHTQVGSMFEVEHDPRVFDCFPSGLEEEAMLRINVGRFAR